MKLTVALRVIGGFGIITLLMLLLGGNALVNLSAIKQAELRVSQQALPDLLRQTGLKEALLVLDKTALEVVQQTSSKELQQLEPDLQASYQALATSVSKSQDDLGKARKQQVEAFRQSVQQLMSTQREQLLLGETLQARYQKYANVADDASTHLLDYTDSLSGQPQQEKLTQLSNALEDQSTSLVSGTTELLKSMDPDRAALIAKELSYNLNQIQQLHDNLSTTNSSSSDLQKALTQANTLLQQWQGSNGIIQGHLHRLELMAKKERQYNQLLNQEDQLLTKLDKQLDTVVGDTKQALSGVGERVNESRWISGVLMLISIIVAITIGYLTLRGISRPLGMINRMLKVMASGNLSQRIEYRSRDEFGDLAANANLVSDNLRELINKIIDNATQLSAAAEETSTVTAQSTQAIRDQKQQVEQAAAAVEQMSSSAQQVAQSANDALSEVKHTDEATKHVHELSETNRSTIQSLASDVGRAAEVIQQLNKDTVQIGTILDVIRGVAEQTNLLALNAAIEAARAGEQGRGFAVVADEVRNLAQRTQQSTEEIQSMIETLQSGAKQAVDVMEQGREQTVQCVQQADDSGEGLNRILESMKLVFDKSSQITTASREQDEVSSEISQKLEAIVTIAEQTSRGAEQTATSSNEVARLSEALKSSVRQFTV